MLNLRIINRRSEGGGIPGHLTILSVSWLNNEFKAVAVHRGEIEAAWECPTATQGIEQFEELLREAVAHTGYRGQYVSLVLAHPRLAQQMFDAPPVKGATLAKVIEIQARRQKIFSGEPSWAWQPAVSPKGIQRVVMHLFPRAIRNQLIQAAKRNKLHLLSIVPPSAVLQHQLAHLPFAQGDCALLAAETAGSTTVVVGRRTGEVVSVRTLPGTWNENAERLAVDINRTILFASQQYGIAVNSGVFLFGPGAAEHVKDLQRHLQAPVGTSPLLEGLYYWATDVLKLRNAPEVNFITPVLQKAPQRRVFAKVVAGAVCVLFCGSVAISGLLLLQARQQKAIVKTLSSQWERLQARHQELQQQDIDLGRKEELVRLVLKDRPGPVPLWFLAYLGEAVPPQLVVTNLHIQQQTNSWLVRLEGTSQPAGPTQTNSDTREALTLFQERLTDGPFHVQIAAYTGVPGEAVPAQAVAGVDGLLNWVRTLATRPGTPPKVVAAQNFVIEGVMR